MRRKPEGAPINPDAEEELRWRHGAPARGAWRCRARQTRRRVEQVAKRYRLPRRLTAGGGC